MSQASHPKTNGRIPIAPPLGVLANTEKHRASPCRANYVGRRVIDGPKIVAGRILNVL